jgi:hypothetical protein
VQNLTSFNFSEVTADCANLTANAQRFEASGMIDADDADKLISACANLENNNFATAFINNATSLTLSELHYYFSVLVEMLNNVGHSAKSAILGSKWVLPLNIHRIFVHS